MAGNDGRTTRFTRPSDREVCATRVYDAPKALVWDCYTKPEHVANWLLGPAGWTMPVCEIDLRIGGKWRYVWRDANGENEFSMSGVYKEIDAPDRAVYTEQFNGQGPEAINTLVITERDGKTTVVATARYATKEICDQVLATGMESGWGESTDRLAGYLADAAR